MPAGMCSPAWSIGSAAVRPTEVAGGAVAQHLFDDVARRQLARGDARPTPPAARESTATVQPS